MELKVITILPIGLHNKHTLIDYLSPLTNNYKPASSGYFVKVGQAETSAFESGK